MDFSADPEAVAAVAEAHRLAYGHLFNRAFATETSRIDPLPHQRLAVYGQMLDQAPLRFLLADDAGAGKTIMTGLYVREMLSRRLIRRVLIVPPAGLVGNWAREMRTLFRLSFRIVSGADARAGNPFAAAAGDRVIVSLDTLAGARMFGRLQETSTAPYDLVVFDEAHKLSAARDRDFTVRKTDRYRLAEALAGAGAGRVGVAVPDRGAAASADALAGAGRAAGADSARGARWALPWSAPHLLLLTATPHMGKDSPYYYLWRLLLPETLSTADAFAAFPADARRRHFIRRTKEEMVRFDGAPIYPQRRCDTLSYELGQGPESEQALYDDTTAYIRDHYNQAQALNRSAARLAMSVFQRRLASSTYALLRSFERRTARLDGLIAEIRSGRLTDADLARGQRALEDLEDLFETQSADDDAAADDGGGEEAHEAFEARALDGTAAVNLAGLETERVTVAGLAARARALYQGDTEEAKFEKLQEVLRQPEYAGQKLIIFTEHRDTASFLVRRLEGLGFTGQVASIHGGMPYQERERQVEAFRRPAAAGGATYLVATDAAGEGINLQFCWLMVNYDIPWNPTRLEQRMGRIHRYGQQHDPVIIVNLIAGSTREGRVLKTLLEKLEAMRRELDSDKVFDVVGRLFEGVSFKDYLQQAVADDDPEAAARRLDGRLTDEQVRALAEQERVRFGDGGDVRRELPRLNEEAAQESYRRLAPGYCRQFIEKTAPLLQLTIDGDLDGAFSLAPARPGALDPLLPALEAYPAAARDRLTVYKPPDREDAIWMHPGEPVFDEVSRAVRGRFGREALRGAVFVDPTAAEASLFHLARVTIAGAAPAGADDARADGADAGAGPSSGAATVESRLVGVRQTRDGALEEWPVEHLLLLRGQPDFPPSRAPVAARARGLAPAADVFVRDTLGERLVEAHRQRLRDTLPAREQFVSRGYDFQMAELTEARARLGDRARAGDARAADELAEVKARQRRLAATRDRRLADLRAEPDRLRVGGVEFLARALIVPTQDPEDRARFDADVEQVAMRVAAGYEEGLGAAVQDVSTPPLARRAGLTDWPGFDVLSTRPDGRQRAIEVKGRAGVGEVAISQNEWSKACNLREGYWLYVVFDCASPRPRLHRVRDPFARLLAREGGVAIASAAVMSAAEPDPA